MKRYYNDMCGTYAQTTHTGRALAIKGASVLAEIEAKRTESARALVQDKRYYRKLKKRGTDAATIRLINQSLRARYKRTPQRPTKARLAYAIRHLLEFGHGPIPWHLPCGTDDWYGERQDHARTEARRLLIAYKWMCAQEHKRAQ